ncbi:MAG: maleylpyruvate isomerase family mycothiol-dependent enzyme [Cellulomonas sp.]|uniref:maleylpyruvate isomerase family mycothiol-dependent enzyme n=1 Tax=Cellulomonas sp. TaxID=40001 RepID=UPI0017D3E514|nr:maleylpyruvate isomerase family mycothiol-dependent enzyme [Cellulomonas sp.]NMM17931.1 maleylpyruvate isomerase family mycothiol-dependent enzyme [Cellulomonas sp.]NMM31574.1 maleylpyruvate isomerase family mycothiol-dependent enzyme [Cellulomonas sp.]
MSATSGHLDHLAELVEAQDAFWATISDVDPATAVPWCGDWRVSDLVEHLARVHHRAAAKARSMREKPLGPGPFVLDDLYRECAAELRDTLVELGPDAIGSTLLGRGPASFWRRRLLHETLVHLWDLRTAGGLRLDARPEVWADTVEEVVTVMQPRQVSRGRMPRLPSAIELAASDVDRTWRLDTADDGPAVVQVRAPASVLALMLWGRIPPDDAEVEVSGDGDVLSAALAEPITP